ncbi:MAG: DUF6391 domain-containing protein [Anaerolineaceae bacterium]|nr:DUF6391 domain-containing protein [Anaerolineaceae bacterium]
MTNHFNALAPIERWRRNHALEHATLHVLNTTNPSLRLAGMSDFRGFWVVGSVDTGDLQLAVDDGLARLQAGERKLATHPNCGTNYAVWGLFASLTAWLCMAGAGRNLRSRLERLPLMVSLVTLTLILTQPLGPMVQERLTTQPDLGGMRVVAITYYPHRQTGMHRVETRF